MTREHRITILGAAFVVPFAVAAALAPARNHIAAPTVALVLVLVVVTIPVLGGDRWAAILAATSAAAGFDFFHTRPFESFAITKGDDVQTALLLFMTAGLVGELAAWGRRHRIDAVEATTDIARISAATDMVGDGATRDTIVVTVGLELADMLMLRDCRFEPFAPEKPYPTLMADGQIVHAGTSWPAEKIGLPGPRVALPVRFRGVVVAHYILTPTPGVAVSITRRRAAATLVAAVAPTLAPQ